MRCRQETENTAKLDELQKQNSYLTAENALLGAKLRTQEDCAAAKQAKLDELSAARQEQVQHQRHRREYFSCPLCVACFAKF